MWALAMLLAIVVMPVLLVMVTVAVLMTEAVFGAKVTVLVKVMAAGLILRLLLRPLPLAGTLACTVL